MGDGAVIGAGTVVAKDIPLYTVAAGVAAKPVACRFTLRGAQDPQGNPNTVTDTRNRHPRESAGLLKNWTKS